eukprot:IDg17948t1
MSNRHFASLVALLGILLIAQTNGSTLPFPPNLVDKSWRDFTQCAANIDLTLPTLSVTNRTIEFADVETRSYDMMNCGDITTLTFGRRPRQPIINYIPESKINKKENPEASCRDGNRELYRIFGETRTKFMPAFQGLYKKSLKAMNSSCNGFPSDNEDVTFILGYLRGIAYDYQIPLD